jgi:prolyl 4-hydroxylase
MARRNPRSKYAKRNKSHRHFPRNSKAIVIFTAAVGCGLAFFWPKFSASDIGDPQKFAGQKRTVRILRNGAQIADHTAAPVMTELSCNKHEWLDKYYTAQGTFVRSCADIDDLATLYSIPLGAKEHFFWPQTGHGDRVVVENIESPVPERQIELEVISEKPRVFFVHNFLSDDEIEKLIRRAEDPSNPYALKPSTVGPESWVQKKSIEKRETSSVRTSENAFDVSSTTALAVKRRAFELLRVPYKEALADGLQIVRYLPGQGYNMHTDFFPIGTPTHDYYHNFDPQTGGANRFATVFLYLNDIEDGRGGQTTFPLADMSHIPEAMRRRLGLRDSPMETTERIIERLPGGTQWEGPMARKCYGGNLAIRPQRGSALLFYNQLPDGRLDPQSLHGGCPVLQGVKWGANMWLWNDCRYSVDCPKLPKVYRGDELP